MELVGPAGVGKTTLARNVHAFEKVIAELSETGRLTVQAMRTEGPLHRGTARLSAALERHRHGH